MNLFKLFSAWGALVIAAAVFLGIVPARTFAATYYLATAAGGGSDSNNGTSPSTPWLTPNHALNCDDQIIAAASTSYVQTNFGQAEWGAVTCSGHGVAWLICATFDACKIKSTNNNGLMITASHWGVQGWEVTASAGQAICFAAYPMTASANLQDIIFANDIANGCYGAGFQPVNNGAAGVDYFVAVADIAYNASQQSVECGSGITIYYPTQTDALPGTHIFVSQTFTWDNVDANPCAGAAPTDGEGVIFDTWNGNGYAAQGVMENNIAIFNGSSGFRVDLSTMAPIYIFNNTAYANDRGAGMNSLWCGEITTQQSLNVVEYNNIARTNAATGCGSNPNYAYFLVSPNSTNQVYSNLGYSAAGYSDTTVGGIGFSLGAGNIFGIDPSFVSAPSSVPAAPSCSGTSSVINCMAPIIADFVAKAPQASGMGYQPVNTTPNSDPFFPAWLCNVNLPVGLVTMGCAANSPPAQPAVLPIQTTP
jgi:hypothetical protein